MFGANRNSGAALVLACIWVAIGAACSADDVPEDGDAPAGAGSAIGAGQPVYGATLSPSDGPAAPVSGPREGRLASASFGALGSGIGLSGIVTARNGPNTEIYVGGATQYFGDDDVWYALRYSASSGDFRQVYVSDFLPQSIRRIALARAGGGRTQIVVALADGTVRRYNQSTKRLLSARRGPCAPRGGLAALVTADLDGNGTDEIVSSCEDQTLAVYGSGYAQWQARGVGGMDVVVGQMDDDPALEIATTGGYVIDAATREVEWHSPAGFGAHLQAADIDGDGRDELIAGEAWYFVWAYDVERQLPKWSVPTNLDVGAIRVADIEDDGVQDLLIGDGQWGSVHAVDTVTEAEEWAIVNPEHGVTDIAVADLNGDGKRELLWGAGATSSGSDHLYVADWQAGTILGMNQHLDGPFIGPEVGDVDGDGIDEVVAVSYTSESQYESGRIVVLDSTTLTMRAISPGVAGGSNAWTGVEDLKLRDLDGDGRPEIVVATDWLYDGLIEAYSFSASNEFTLVWTNQVRPEGSPFESIEVADIDGDGVVEVVAGGSRYHTGADGVFIYVYDVATGAEKWHTLQMGDYWSEVTDLVVADIDDDGEVEVAGLVEDGDVYVFDGATKALEAVIAAEGTSLEAIPAGDGTDLLLGDATGHMGLRSFDGSGYPEVGGANFGPEPIEGLSVLDDGGLWVGSGGIMRRFDQVLGGVQTFASANYGEGLGQRVVALPGRPIVFSAGGYGVHAFRVDGPGVE